MSKILQALILLSILSILLPLPSPGAVQEYMGANGVTPVKVASSTPLPVAMSGSVGEIDVRVTSSTVSLSVQQSGDDGILGYSTLSIPLHTAVALPTAPANATKCFIFPTKDVNWGTTAVASGTSDQYFFQSIPGQGIFGSEVWTGYRLIGRTAVATATIIWR